MNYYPHHIGDFNSATRHLTRVERSVYRDLIELYYDTEAPLTRDVDKLCRLLIARSDDEQAAVTQVLNEFFTATEQGWRHARCDAEIARYHGNKAAKSVAGKASAAKRAGQAQCEREQATARLGAAAVSVQQPLNADATNQEPEPTTSNQQPYTEKPRKRAAGFDASSIALPAWLDRDDWASWVADRKDRKKPITEQGARRQLQQLAGYRADGVEPREVIAHSIASGYLGLYPPRETTKVQPAASTRRAGQRAQWSSELRSVLAEGQGRSEIDLGVIDASCR